MLAAVAERHETPCYVYFMDQIYDRIRALGRAFDGDLKVSYAVKSNPNPAILRRLRGHVDFLDVSSAGELILATESGWASGRLSFTGPGKSNRDLQAAASRRIGCVVLESVEEAVRLHRFLPAAEGANAPQSVLVRVALARPPARADGQPPDLPDKFGINEGSLHGALDQIMRLPHFRVRGFHTYQGGQNLDAEAVAEKMRQFLRACLAAAIPLRLRPELIILGAGLGIPYTATAKPIDLELLARLLRTELAEFRSKDGFERTQFVLETGRYLVGEAGCYLTRVLYLKSSGGETIAICDGGMHHNLGACRHLGILGDHYEVARVSGRAPGGDERPYCLAGPLCTPHDTFARRAMLPTLAVGDLIAIFCSGAYGFTASPVHFISHDPPKEILIELVGGKFRTTDVSPFIPRAVPCMIEETISLELPHLVGVAACEILEGVARTPEARLPDPLEPGPEWRDLTPTEAYYSLQGVPALVLLDVRSPSAFCQAHIEGARNAPLDVLPAVLSTLPPALGYLVVGDDEKEEFAACHELVRLGITRLNYLQGGLPHWASSGLPLTGTAVDASSRDPVKV